ncbi:DctM TRAP-type C4-dicarboxylate transport system, small permease component [Burkholderiaceae bacterium]
MDASLDESKFASLVRKLTNLQLIICELVLGALAVCISLDALLRWSVNWSILVVDELGGYALVCLAFFGFSIALHEKALFRVDAFYDWLSPINRARFQFVFDILTLAFMLLLLWHFWGLVTRSHAKEISALTMLRTPIWIPQLLMVVGACSTSLVLVVHVINDYKMVFKTNRKEALNG